MIYKTTSFADFNVKQPNIPNQFIRFVTRYRKSREKGHWERMGQTVSKSSYLRIILHFQHPLQSQHHNKPIL